MLLARTCRMGASPTLVSLVKTSIIPRAPKLPRDQITRLFKDGRNSYTRTARRRITLKEQSLAPAGETGKLDIFIYFIVLVHVHLN